MTSRQDQSDSGDAKEKGTTTFDIFSGPPRRVERVESALGAYLQKVREMQEAMRNLLGRVADMCPKQWRILAELKVYLEDQSMLWCLAETDLRPMFNNLKKFSALIKDAKSTVGEFEIRLAEVHAAKAEYELMKNSPSVTKTKKIQIEYLLRETNRALRAIRNDAENKLLRFRRSQTELSKELLQKFEDVHKVTCEESLQVIDLVEDRLNAVPVKKLNRKGHPVEDIEFVQNFVQSIVNGVEATPVDLSSKLHIYNPKPERRNQDTQTSRARLLTVAQGQHSGTDSEGHVQTKQSDGNTARPYSGSSTAGTDRGPSRVSRPKALTAGKETDTNQNVSKVDKPSFTSSIVIHLGGATPYRNSERNAFRHVQPPAGTNYNSGSTACSFNAFYSFESCGGQGRSNVGPNRSSGPSAPPTQMDGRTIESLKPTTPSPQQEDRLLRSSMPTTSSTQQEDRTAKSSGPLTPSTQQEDRTARSSRSVTQSTQEVDRTARSSRPVTPTTQQEDRTARLSRPVTPSIQEVDRTTRLSGSVTPSTQQEDRIVRSSRPVTPSTKQENRTARSSRPVTPSTQQEDRTRSSRPVTPSTQQEDRTRSSRPVTPSTQQEDRTSRSSRPVTPSTQQDGGANRLSRPSTPSSQSGGQTRRSPGNITPCSHQNQSCAALNHQHGFSGLLCFKPIKCNSSIEDLYTPCKPAEAEGKNHRRKSRLPFKSTTFPACSVQEGDDDDFYDCR